MTIATWPDILPAAEISSYQQSRQNARRSRSAQIGPPRRSRRFSSVAEVVAMQVTLDAEQLGVFEMFFEETLIEGSLPFYMIDAVRDGRALLDGQGVPILDDGDLPIFVSVTRLCLWGAEPPRLSARTQKHFRMGFSVVFMP